MDAPGSRDEIEDLLAQRIPHEPFPQYVDETVFLEVSGFLQRHPDKQVQKWSKKPRLYTLLRMLDYHEASLVFHKFEREDIEIDDFWLPIGNASLNKLSLPDDAALKLYQNQRHVLSRSERLGEEKLFSPVRDHRHIQDGSFHFDEMGQIGEGGSAKVVRVKHKLSGKLFACKRILRAETPKGQCTQLREFKKEVDVLKGISHRHLITLVASFTDLASFSLILHPVAEEVLKSVLERQSRAQPLTSSDLSTLRHAFGCLTTAIQFLHQNRVKHEDIKPSNILVSEGRVYLCDFGISTHWSPDDRSTTESDPLKLTRRYCAPEVAGKDARNTKADIWSLGCVFLELISVVKGYPLDELNKFLLDHNAGASPLWLYSVPDALHAWLTRIRSENKDSADDLPLDWIIPMIRTNSKDRHSATDVLDMIHKQSADIPRPGLFIASCCARSDSFAPTDYSGSPTTTEPIFRNALGIQNSSISPPRSYLNPDKDHSVPSIDVRSNDSNARNSSSRDCSISPRTKNKNPRSSDDTAPILPTDALGSPTNVTVRPIFPIAPPASFVTRCACAARPKEKHIFNATLDSPDAKNAPVTLDSSMPTVETCTKCEIRENKVQIYETPPEDPSVGRSSMPMLWWVTRRLVVSYLSGSPEMRICSSFWLPLADIHFVVSNNEVTLRWSDCNQMTGRSSGNYGQHYDWLYDPNNPNNTLTIRFYDPNDVQRFVDTVRLPWSDGVSVGFGRRINVSNSTELNVFDVGRPGVRNYRVASLTTPSPDTRVSKLFIQWPEIDLDIRIFKSAAHRIAAVPDYQMAIELKNVATPTYHSDTRGEPAVDHQKVGRFSKALQLKTSLSVTFPIGMEHDLPNPPTAVVDMLNALTGWTLRYFAIVEKFKSKNKHISSKKYGLSDVMLWEKEIDGGGIGVKRRGAMVTFRLHNDPELLWISGAITRSTNISYPTGFDATITISNKTKGKLLDVGKMTAVASENVQTPRHAHSRSMSDAHEDHSDLVLTFEDSRYRLEFVKLIEEFKAAAAAAGPLARVSTLVDSDRRINSLASNDIRMNPSMR